MNKMSFSVPGVVDPGRPRSPIADRGKALSNFLFFTSQLDEVVFPLIDFHEADSRSVATFLHQQLSAIKARSNHPPEIVHIVGTNTLNQIVDPNCPGFPNVTLHKEHINMGDLIDELARQWNATYTISNTGIRFQRKDSIKNE